MYNFFYSLISFFIALLLILTGIIGLIIPWSGSIRAYLIEMITNDSLALSLFGFAFVIIGTAITANILLNSRRSYYHIKTSDGTVLVDEGIVQEYLKIYWRELMPEAQIYSRVTLKNNQIAIAVDFPFVPKPGQKPLLEKVRVDLQDWLRRFLGYQDEFHLHATFQKK
jgi:uncharacterized protein YjeT (DUF2065 family)